MDGHNEVLLKKKMVSSARLNNDSNTMNHSSMIFCLGIIKLMITITFGTHPFHRKHHWIQRTGRFMRLPSSWHWKRSISDWHIMLSFLVQAHEPDWVQAKTWKGISILFILSMRVKENNYRRHVCLKLCRRNCTKVRQTMDRYRVDEAGNNNELTTHFPDFQLQKAYQNVLYMQHRVLDALHLHWNTHCIER